MTLYLSLWWCNLATTLAVLVVAYVAGLNADRPVKKLNLAMLALACVLEVIFSVQSLMHAFNWVDQAVYIAVAGQVKILVIKVPLLFYIINTSRSVKSWLGFCRYRRVIHWLPKPSPHLESMGSIMRDYNKMASAQKPVI